jgi:hypothetical protein
LVTPTLCSLLVMFVHMWSNWKLQAFVKLRFEGNVCMNLHNAYTLVLILMYVKISMLKSCNMIARQLFGDDVIRISSSLRNVIT